MDAINNNINFSASSPEIKKRMQSQENFSALDTQKLKQDTAEFTKNATEDIKKENILFRALRFLGHEDPKKSARSIFMSIATVILVAIAANKAAGPANKLGHIIDEILTGDNILGKSREGVINLFKGIKKSTIDKLPTPKFISNAQEALKNPLKPKWTIFRGYENGAKGLFSNTIKETIDTAMGKNKEAVIKTLTNLLGGNAEKANEIINDMASMEKVKFAEKLVNEIKKANNCIDNPKKLGEIFQKLSAGEFGDGLTGVKMDQGGLMGAWWPANFVNKIYKGITGKDNKYLQGDLGDSLAKYCTVRGKLAKTLPAKIVQIIPSLAGDQVSNFVNDKSGFGIFLCANLIGNFNNLQDAPKEKKVVTAVNDVATGSLSWLTGMPIAYGIVYSLASLSKMNATGIPSKILKNIGKVFALGLNQPGKLGGVKGVAGGIGRFLLVFLVLQPFVSKKISQVCSKIFGKPYDASEAKRQKAIEEEQSKVIPELGITQKEFADKLQANPQALQKLQNDSMLQKEIASNPKLILDLLDNKEIKTKPKDKLISPANRQFVLNHKLNKITNNTQEARQGNNQIDSANYIPSSEFRAKSVIDEKQKMEFDKLISNADSAIERAEKLFK